MASCLFLEECKQELSEELSEPEQGRGWADRQRVLSSLAVKGSWGRRQLWLELWEVSIWGSSGRLEWSGRPSWRR